MKEGHKLMFKRKWVEVCYSKKRAPDRGHRHVKLGEITQDEQLIATSRMCKYAQIKGKNLQKIRYLTYCVFE